MRIGIGRGQRWACDDDIAGGDGHTDVQDTHGAAMPRRGLQQVRGLGGTQRERDVEIRQDAQDRAVIGADAARQVDRDRQAGRVCQPPQRPGNLLARRARQAGAEQRVEQHGRRRGVRQRINGASPRGARLSGRVGAGLAGGGNAHGDTALGQRARRDIAVAAIIARPAQHEHRRAAAEPPHGLGDGMAGTIHQGVDRRTTRNGFGFSRAHRRDREHRRSGKGRHEPCAAAPFTVAGRR